MKNIWVDIDEVLAETCKYFLEHLDNKVWNLYLKWEDLIEYNFRDLPWINISKEEIMKFWYDIMTDNIINIWVIDGSYNALKKFKNNWYNFFAVTWRSHKIKEHTYKWLEKNFPNIFNDVYFSNNWLKNEIKKSQLIKDLNIEIFIEDNIVFAEDIYETWAQIYLFNKPWNKNKKLKYSDIIRVDSWNEIIL